MTSSVEERKFAKRSPSLLDDINSGLPLHLPQNNSKNLRKKLNFKSFASPRDEEVKDMEPNVLDIFDFYPANCESRLKPELTNINIMNNSANSITNKNKMEKIVEKKWDPYYVKIESLILFVLIINRTILF